MKINLQNYNKTFTTNTSSPKLEYDSLSEIYELIQSYQKEKSKLFQQYLNLSELIKNENQINNRKTLEDAQNMVWEKHLYLDHLIKKCFMETTKRVFETCHDTTGFINSNRLHKNSNRKSRSMNISQVLKKICRSFIASYR
jgi:hypothetical protein